MLWGWLWREPFPIPWAPQEQPHGTALAHRGLRAAGLSSEVAAAAGVEGPASLRNWLFIWGTCERQLRFPGLVCQPPGLVQGTSKENMDPFQKTPVGHGRRKKSPFQRAKQPGRRRGFHAALSLSPF